VTLKLKARDARVIMTFANIMAVWAKRALREHYRNKGIGKRTMPRLREALCTYEVVVDAIRRRKA
jgi:hypothetical protein